MIAPRRRVGLGAIAIALAVLTVTAAIAAVWLVHRNGLPFAATTVAFALPFLSFAAVGAVVAARRPELPLGWLLLTIAASITGYACLEQYATYALVTAPGALPAGASAAWLRVSMWVPGALITLVYLPLLFPTGAPPTPRWRPVGWVAGAVGAAIVVLRQVAATGVDAVLLVAPGDVWVQQVPLARVADAMFPLVLVCSLLAWASLTVRFRRSRGVERLQLRWVRFGFAVFLVAFVGSMALSHHPVGDVLVAIAVLAIAASLGITVLRYRLYEIDRVVSRTVSYVVVMAVLLGTYLVAVVVAQAVLRPVSAESELAVAVSTLATVALFQPVRQRVQAAVDQHFNRGRYDAQRTVDAFATTIRDEVDLTDLVGGLRAVAAATVQPRQVAVWLGPPAERGNDSGTLSTYNT